MAEEEIIKKRLAVEGDGGGDDRRIMSLVKTFVRWCNSEQLGDEESEATYQKMLFTLGQCEFSFTKTQMVMDMNKREMERYEQVYSEIERNIAEAEQQIAQYREELQESREIRRHRQEYDALAQVIQKHPPRQESKEKIAELEQKLQTLVSTRDGLHSKLQLRRKQFHLLMHSIHQLQDLMSSEPQDMETS